jgi:hypothetical protein
MATSSVQWNQARLRSLIAGEALAAVSVDAGGMGTGVSAADYIDGRIPKYGAL